MCTGIRTLSSSKPPNSHFPSPLALKCRAGPGWSEGGPHPAALGARESRREMRLSLAFEIGWVTSRRWKQPIAFTQMLLR